MNRDDVLRLIAGGEGSGVELKRSVDNNRKLAQEIVSFANLSGGTLLIGVDDDGSVVGTTGGQKLEQWVMEACRTKIRPPLVPYYQEVEIDPGHKVAVVRVERGYAVHAVWHDHHLSYYLRVGSTTQEASPEELARLFQQRGSVRAEVQPVSGATLDHLDLRRMHEYLTTIREQSAPDTTDREAWTRLAVNTEYMTDAVDGGIPVATLAGVLLFGLDLAKFAPFAGIDATAYPGTTKTYETIDRERVVAPLTPLGPRGHRTEQGLVEDALSFVRRNLPVSATIDPSGERVERRALPLEAVREVVVNAIVHRDYMLTGSDIELALYRDRLEVISPGRLPNGITPDRMRQGTRAARNQLIKDTLRDYGLLEHRGMGIPFIVMTTMREHNGTEPDLVILDDERFLVRLRIAPADQPR